LIVLILFNILIAIILDTYEHLREEIGRRVLPQTLWQQFSGNVVRWRRERRLGRVPLASVWMACLDYYGPEFHSDEPFTIEELKKVVPKMSDDQAEDLIVHAEVELWAQFNEEPPAIRVPHDLRRLRKVWKHLECLLLEGPPSSLPASPRRKPKGGSHAAMVSVVQKGLNREPTEPCPASVALPLGFENFAIHDGNKQLRLDGAVAVLRLAEKLAERPNEGVHSSLTGGGSEQDQNNNVVRAIKLSLALCDWYPTSGSSSDVPGMMPGGHRLPSESNGTVNSSKGYGIMCCRP